MPFQVQEGEAFEPGSSSRQGTTNQAGSALNGRGFGEGAYAWLAANRNGRDGGAGCMRVHAPDSSKLLYAGLTGFNAAIA